MRCLPSERRAKPAGEWNHYHVTCSNGVIQLAVNGKVVSGGSESKPRKGYICLESEGSECHFRNLRIKELPSTQPPPEAIAPLAEAFKPLYTGVDLSGWKKESGHQGHWQPKDWILDYDGKSEAADKNLWSEKEYGDFVLVCDWRWTNKGTKRLRPVIMPSGDYATDAQGKQKEIEVLDAGDSGIYLRGSSKSQVNIWCWPSGSGEVWGYRLDQSQPAEVRAAVTPKLNADKPIGPALKLCEALNEYVVNLVSPLPDGAQRAVLLVDQPGAEPRRPTVGRVLLQEAEHAREHLAS